MANSKIVKTLKTSGNDTTFGTIISQPGLGVNWIEGVKGESAGIYVKKQALNTNQWITGMAVQTKSGGGWAIGNYNNENLEFVYGTKANIDSNTNTVSRWQITSEGIFTGYTNYLRTPNASGFYTDQYGNFIHTSTNTGNAWCIMNNAGSSKFKVVYESGDVTVGNWKASVINTQYGGTGNANGTVAKLTTARTIQTNLGSTSSASFDGSANVTPGVTGTLKVANGGTEATTPDAACAKLGAVKKSGDTMNGDLKIQCANNIGITTYSTNYGHNNAPSKSVWPFELGCKTKDDTYFGYLAWIQDTDKSVSARLTARYHTSSVQYNNNLVLKISPNGTPYVGLNYPKAWCDALVGDTYNCTLASGVTGTCKFYYWGRMGYIHMSSLKKSSVSSGWNTIATLPSGFSAIADSFGQIFDDAHSVDGYPPSVEAKVSGSTISLYGPLANTNHWGGFCFVIGKYYP